MRINIHNNSGGAGKEMGGEGWTKKRRTAQSHAHNGGLGRWWKTRSKSMGWEWRCLRWHPMWNSWPNRQRSSEYGINKFGVSGEMGWDERACGNKPTSRWWADGYWINRVTSSDRICKERNGKCTQPVGSLDVCRILDDASRKLRECIPESGDTLGLHLEPTLLGHRRIPTVRSECKYKNMRKGYGRRKTPTCSKQWGW